MKRYIRSSEIVSATSYKDDDLRLPLIKSIEEVLGIDFQGAKSQMQYAEKWDRYLGYQIFSKNNKYKMSIYQSSSPEPEYKDGRLKYADPEIITAVQNFLKENYPDYYSNSNIKYGFVVCRAFLQDESSKQAASKIEDEISDLVLYSKFDSKDMLESEFPSSYKAYKDYVTLTWTYWEYWNAPGETPEEDLVNLVKSAGYHIKSSSVTKGYSKGYGHPDVPSRLQISIYYN